MLFREKIDKILKDNKLGINTVYGLEAFIGASPGSISKPLNKGDTPGLGTIKKIREGLPGLNPEWWEDGKGDVFEKNGTYVEIPTSMNKSEEPSKRMPADEVLRQLIKGDSEYILINKELILEKYRLVSLEEIEEQKKESQRKHDEILRDLEERKNQIHGLYRIIQDITAKIPDSNKAVLDKAQ
jgi:hypothetical protein